MSNLIAINNNSLSVFVSEYTVSSIDSANSEIVDVINENGNKFKAYKYLIDNTYYYYVVDGIHSFWIDDLSSIGYRETLCNSIEVLFGISCNKYTGIFSSSTFGQSGYKYSLLRNIEDANTCIDFGLSVASKGSSVYVTSPFGFIFWSDDYTFEPIELYADFEGLQPNEADMSWFYCTDLNGYLAIRNLSGSAYSYDEECMSWKCRITKKL